MQSSIWKSMNYIRRLIVISAFISGILTIVASSGGGGSSANQNAPNISNLSYNPRSAELGAGGGAITMFGSVDFTDTNGNISQVILNIFDSAMNQIDSVSSPIQGASGITSGTIQASYSVNTTVEDTYTFDVYIVDTTNLTSNILTGTFTITNPPWKTKTSMPMRRRMMGSVTVNGKIYVIGGRDGTTLRDETMVYDPTTETWTFAAPIPAMRSGLAVSAVNGKIYAIGGTNLGTYVNTVEEYDPITDTWSTNTSMPTERSGLSAGVVNGRIYAIGGQNNIPVLDTVEEYDPITDTWASKTSMPTRRTRMAAAVVNDKIYVIGGLDGGGGWSGNVEEYDPATDTWTLKASMPTRRRDLALAVLNGKIYAIGGVGYDPNNALVYDVVEEYDPATDTWASKTAMPTGREYLTASSVNNKIYALGGSIGAGGSTTFDTVEEYDASLD